MRGVHRGPVNSPHKGPVTRKMFPFDDVIMCENDNHTTEAQTNEELKFISEWLKISRISRNINTMRPRQNGRHFADDIYKCIFMNENEWISLKIPLKFVPKGQFNKIPPLVQIMAWRRPGDKPLSEAMVVSLLTQICATRPQWVKTLIISYLLIDVLADQV